MFYSIFLIFFVLQKYYLMICSCTFTHMTTERNVWKMRRTCTHIRLHHDPYVSRSQRKEKQVPDRCSILTSTWTQPDGLYVRFSFTTGASQEATQAVSTTWDLRFISRDAKRDESKLAGKKLAPHALDLPSKVPDVQAQRQSEQRHRFTSKNETLTSKVSGSNRRSSVLPPFQPCVDEVPHAVLDGKLVQ